MYEVDELYGYNGAGFKLRKEPDLPFNLSFKKPYARSWRDWEVEINKKKWEENEHLFNLEEQVLQIRNSIQKANTETIFTPEVISEFKERGLKYPSVSGVICSAFGFDLSQNNQGYSDPIKVLQIGCGPYDFYASGPRMSEELLSLGADVINLDVLDVSNHYPKGRFIRGSWFDLDSLFQENPFDVIFAHSLNPSEIRSQADARKKAHEPLDVAYGQLLAKTIHCLKERRGFFMISEPCICDFYFPRSCPLPDEINRFSVNSEKEDFRTWLDLYQ